jgi:TRAP-type mannitol/chloroaromatic compound transport system permease small subunit
MPKIILLYVRYVDAINRRLGDMALYLIFAMMGILLFSAVSRYFFNAPVIWGVEMAQFCMAAYYILGGGFALLLNSHVRMDVLYSRWSRRGQAGMDVFTSFFLVVYLGFLLYGCISSTAYSIEFHQRNNSAWAPPLAPIKCIMAVGILLTLLQAIAEFFRSLARTRGLNLGLEAPENLLPSEECRNGTTAPTGRETPAPALPAFGEGLACAAAAGN